MAPTARNLRAGLKVSVVGQLGAAIGQSSNALAQGGLATLWGLTDMVAVTYYPMTAAFQVQSPSVVESDVATLVGLFPSKQVYFNEAGYPSGALDGSSQSLQQQFISRLFTAWDRYPTQIPYLNVLRLNDTSLAAAQAQAANYGLGGNAAFVEFLQTLGIRTHGGANKAAYTQLMAETAARGW